MTVLASRFAYDDYDEDYRSDLDAKYEEGFGQGPELAYDDEDEFDDLFTDLFDEDDDDDAPSGTSGRTVTPRKSPASKMPTPRVPAARTLPPAGVSAPELPTPEDTDPEPDPTIAALTEAAARARVAAESAGNAAKRAVSEAVAKAAAAKAAAAEASAAEEAAQLALARSTEADELARTAADRLAEAERAVQRSSAEALAEPPASAESPDEATDDAEPRLAVVPDVLEGGDPLRAPSIAPVTEHVDFLRKLRPGLEVPYVDPMHSAEECRIVSLFSNTGEASPQGFVWAGDDSAATRLLGLQYQLGLRPEWIMPWNTHPWFTPGEANGKLTPDQVQAGLKPLLALLKLLPRASAIVAHGPEANRLAQMLLKTGNPLIWRRGLKVYKARSLHGRSFAGSKERQTEWLIEMGKAYADAMARAGLQLRRA